MPRGYTPLLAPSDVRALVSHLPSRCVGKDWHLAFCSDRDGYSLLTLYNRVKGRGPSIVAVMDDKGHVFCGFASRDFSGSDLVTATTLPFGSPGSAGGRPASYFGSGESFLARIRPDFAVYRWTRRNNSFLLARSDGLAFGGGGGKFGLWLDGDLEAGSSGVCDTYGNAPLASSEMFKVVRVEVWCFGQQSGLAAIGRLAGGGLSLGEGLGGGGGGGGISASPGGGSLGAAAMNLMTRLKRTTDMRGASSGIST
jgi:hypothetical protein